jgi:riboflavin synthase
VEGRRETAGSEEKEIPVFTGLVKCIGKIKDASPFGQGRRLRVDIGELARSAEIGASIAVNGVCLTITSLAGEEAAFDAVTETVRRTNLGALRAGDDVNLEPALRTGDALDGHIVLGHVDALAPVLAIDAAAADNRVVTIALPPGVRHLVAEKGSIAVDGISLTVASAGEESFTVSVIPHTWAHSSLSALRVGAGVNLEADVMARYAARILGVSAGGEKSRGGLTESFLRENGYG